MKSMKITAEERKAKEKKYENCIPSCGEKYPYGLRIHLDDDVMSKLGLKSLPKTGTKMALTAEVNVESTESRDSTDGKRESMSIQITAMELTPKGSATDAINKSLEEAE